MVRIWIRLRLGLRRFSTRLRLVSVRVTISSSDYAFRDELEVGVRYYKPNSLITITQARVSKHYTRHTVGTIDVG